MCVFNTRTQIFSCIDIDLYDFSANSADFNFTWNFYFGIIFPSGSFLFGLCYAYLFQCLHYIFLMTYLIVAVYLAGC